VATDSTTLNEATQTTVKTFRVEIRPNTQSSEALKGLTQLYQNLPLTGLATVRLFFLKGTTTPEEINRFSKEVLADPLTETFSVYQDARPAPEADTHTVEVTFLPGVTDAAAANILHAASVTNIKGLTQAATGTRYELKGNLTVDDLKKIAVDVFSNPVIQRAAIDATIALPFLDEQPVDRTVETIALKDATDEQLENISKERRLALNLAEMQAIRAYFAKENREPTDAELEMLAQTWSEHCVHKTFKAEIDYTGPLPGKLANPAPQKIDGLLKTYIRSVTDKLNRSWVRSAFVDNAGIIAFNENWELAFKVETHNHPSALEPFGGANTGVGGVVRDVMGVSARPIANTDVLCFGPSDQTVPAGVLSPTRIEAGVVQGIEDYGNKMGIPTVNGAVLYHPGYTANPLVFCGCLGLLPAGSHVTGAKHGDLIVVVGGRTGRDGLRGATFSSLEMDDKTSQVSGSSVQIGHPIHEKQTLEAILRARDAKLYRAITDCGAGGLSSAVGEMGAEIGANVQLEKVPLKYPGLRPWEIWLSEAQERMVLAVPPENWTAFEALCNGQNIEAVQIGTFGAEGNRLELKIEDKTVGNLSMDFLHNGIPRRKLQATWEPVAPAARPVAAPPRDHTDALLKLLAHPNIRSKEAIVRKYDHEVQGGGAVKPFVGIADHGPSDAAVLVPQGAKKTDVEAVRGVGLSNGIAPLIGERDPYLMAYAAIDEAMRNLVAVGVDPEQVAILDNFCWGNPNLPDRLGSLVRCAQGCYDAALAYGVPFISGKDSLNNEYTDPDGTKHAIPGTLLISAMGIAPDVRKTITMNFKKPGNLIYLIGQTRDELGGSHYEVISGNTSSAPPQPVSDALEIMQILHKAINAGLVISCHDCSEGGVAVALAEMCIAGRVGAKATLPNKLGAEHKTLFSESLCRFIVEVRPGDSFKFQRVMRNFATALGTVREGGELVIEVDSSAAIMATVEELEEVWRGEVKQPYPPVTIPERKVTAKHPDWRLSTRTGAVRALILHANGSNRDHDADDALRLAGAEPEIVHVNQLASGERKLEDYHMLIVPGGFSYGDDLGAGVVWALDLKNRLGESVQKFINDGRPVLGICNGFQALVKAGLLPGSTFSSERSVTLTYNEMGKFECRWVALQPVAGSVSLFTEGLTEPILAPVAHGEGRIAVKDNATLEKLWTDGLVALTYSDEYGRPVGYPGNPNGSTDGIAALCNPAGNVLGLMPHPENHIFAWQHPRREVRMSGLRLFKNGVKYA